MKKKFQKPPQKLGPLKGEPISVIIILNLHTAKCVTHVYIHVYTHVAITQLKVSISSILEGSFVPPPSQYTPTKVIFILQILALLCRRMDWLAQWGSPIVPMTELLLKKWHDPAPCWHIEGNTSNLESKES